MKFCLRLMQMLPLSTFLAKDKQMLELAAQSGMPPMMVDQVKQNQIRYWALRPFIQF